MLILENFIHDVRHGARLLARNPLFALTAVMSLAIGIGANTTVFTIANGLLFGAPSGVTEPERIVDISGVSVGQGPSSPQTSYPKLLEIRERSTTLESVYGFGLAVEPMSMSGTSGSERIYAQLVTTNYFTTLGVRPAAGRFFGPSDSEAAGASPAVVLTYSFWTRRFGNSSFIVGQTLQLNGQPFTVIGIAPETFHGTNIIETDVWVPTSMVDIVMSGNAGNTKILKMREAEWLMLGARLKLGVSLAQAQAELETINRVMETDTPNFRERNGNLVPFKSRLTLTPTSPVPNFARLPVTGFLSLLTAIVTLVLMIACANVAGVLIARAAARSQEIAVRLAIGAGRTRIVGQLITETMLLFIIGGGVGLLLAQGMTSFLVSLVPALPIPLHVALALDTRVVLFTTLLSLATALLSAIAPAWRASKADVVAGLREKVEGSRDRLRLRNVFVAGQVAFSILLVIGAGLLMRALQRAGAIDPGFDPAGIELADVDLSLGGYKSETGRLFLDDLMERLHHVSAVQSATAAAIVPLSGGMIGAMSLGGLSVPGVSPPNGQRFFNAQGNIVEPGYFETMRIPLIAGRDFSAADQEGAPLVAIIGEATARRFWPGQSAIGKELFQQSLLIARGGDPAGQMQKLQVIGVARDPKYTSLTESAPPLYVYVPFTQRYTGKVTIVARSANGQRLATEIRRAVSEINPQLPIISTRTIQDGMALSLVPQRVAAWTSGSLGMIGLVLASIGIYGVTAYAVTRRTREIGIRIALGARRTDVVRMISRQAMTLILAGGALGLILAAVAGRLLNALLFGVPPIDPVTFTAAAGLFLISGIVACYVPVRRATRIEPMDALRQN